MNLLKSVLAALFVAELAYVLSVAVIAVIDTGGIKKDVAIGIGAWSTYVFHPLAIAVAALAFMLALVLFLRT
jgi:hypothetical protein